MDEQEFWMKERMLREKIEYIQKDYDGLKAVLEDCLRSNGAKEINTEYIVDEMEADLEGIIQLKKEYELLLQKHAKCRSTEEHGNFGKNNVER